MRTEGKVVAIAQLCRWFGVPRSTFYYRGERRRAAELDRDLVELVGRLQWPSCWRFIAKRTPSRVS